MFLSSSLTKIYFHLYHRNQNGETLIFYNDLIGVIAFLTFFLIISFYYLIILFYSLSYHFMIILFRILFFL